MKRRSIYVFLATTLAILVPSPGRFIYGIVLVLELNLLMLVGTASVSLIKKIKMEEMMTVCVIMFLLAATILFRQIFIIFQPEIILTLGFIIFLIPVSLFMMGYIFSDSEKKLSERLRRNMIHSLTYSVFALLYFLLRDLIGFGTFTFFGKNHQIFEKVIIDSDKLGVGSILASIPGSLILSAILLYVYIFVRNKIDIYHKAEVSL